VKAQELVDLLNELAGRLPRIVATLALQRVPIDVNELTGLSGRNQFGMLTGERPLNVCFFFTNNTVPTMSFVDLLGGLCDDGTITVKVDKDGKAEFSVGVAWPPL
jgi:hypothetical protein